MTEYRVHVMPTEACRHECAECPFANVRSDRKINMGDLMCVLGQMEKMLLDCQFIRIGGGGEVLLYDRILEVFDLCRVVSKRSHVLTGGLPPQSGKLLAQIANSQLGLTPPNPHSLYYRYFPLVLTVDSTDASLKGLEYMLDAIGSLAIYRRVGRDEKAEEARIAQILESRGYSRSTYLFQDMPHDCWKRHSLSVYDFPSEEHRHKFMCRGFARHEQCCSLSADNPVITISPAGISPCWHPVMAKWPLTSAGLADMIKSLPELHEFARSVQGCKSCQNCSIAHHWPDQH